MHVCQSLACVLDWANRYLAVIIAVIALVTAIWQASIARKHNRLSVKPLLTIYGDSDILSPDAAHPEFPGVQVGTYKCLLRNAGVGPAVITSYTISLDGKPISTAAASFRQTIGDLLRAANHNKPYFPSVAGNISYPHPMRSNEDILTFGIITPVASSDWTTILNQFSRLSLQVVYESVYEERFELSGSLHAPDDAAVRDIR